MKLNIYLFIYLLLLRPERKLQRLILNAFQFSVIQIVNEVFLSIAKVM